MHYRLNFTRALKKFGITARALGFTDLTDAAFLLVCQHLTACSIAGKIIQRLMTADGTYLSACYVLEEGKDTVTIILLGMTADWVINDEGKTGKLMPPATAGANVGEKQTPDSFINSLITFMVAWNQHAEANWPTPVKFPDAQAVTDILFKRVDQDDWRFSGFTDEQWEIVNMQIKRTLEGVDSNATFNKLVSCYCGYVDIDGNVQQSRIETRAAEPTTGVIRSNQDLLVLSHTASGPVAIFGLPFEVCQMMAEEVDGSIKQLFSNLLKH